MSSSRAKRGNLTISILGAGSWGLALAVVMSKIADVSIWSRHREQVELINDTRTDLNYLPKGIVLADNVTATTVIDPEASDLVILATPINAMRITLGAIQPIPLLWACKGFEADTGALPHEIINDVWPDFDRYGALLGPSFAKEAALGLPTAVTVSSKNLQFVKHCVESLRDIPNFRIYGHADIIGSEIGAAIKNVIAIAVGISDGLALGNNARAALITRSLSEITRLVTALGGQQETIFGLAGIGDLILTCTGDLSRNRTVGLRLALGESLTNILDSLGHVAEGVPTTKEVYKKANQYNIDMPISAAVYNILYNNSNIAHEVTRLMGREPKFEFEFIQS